ncbi:hypothetical protein VNI00_007766 [Paramarasmius palmivorus]|uniref:Uncharacterized protein n=1 Tax=Paramarasmius palmivorus TaxID=297713 RepID=A0AAW0CZ20_9AGAR
MYPERPRCEDRWETLDDTNRLDKRNLNPTRKATSRQNSDTKETESTPSEQGRRRNIVAIKPDCRTRRVEEVKEQILGGEFHIQAQKRHPKDAGKSLNDLWEAQENSKTTRSTALEQWSGTEKSKETEHTGVKRDQEGAPTQPKKSHANRCYPSRPTAKHAQPTPETSRANPSRTLVPRGTPKDTNDSVKEILSHTSFMADLAESDSGSEEDHIEGVELEADEESSEEDSEGSESEEGEADEDVEEEWDKMEEDDSQTESQSSSTEYDPMSE